MGVSEVLVCWSSWYYWEVNN